SAAGWNSSVCASTCVHLPGVAGTSFGSFEPSASETGSANVSVNVLDGATRVFGAGSATTWTRAPGVNHETRTGCESDSQGRTAAATVVAPAAVLPDATTPSGTTARTSSRCTRPPIATRLTGVSKRIATADPSAGRRRGWRTGGTGVTTLTVRSTWRPTSQPIQPGRRRSTVTVSFSPGARRSSGQIVSWLTRTASGFPCGSTTETLSTWPAKPGSEIPARPVLEAP